MTSLSRIPGAVTRTYGKGISHPVIAEEFHPERGWIKPGWNKRITASYARKLRQQGVTFVALRMTDEEGRTFVADYRTSELTSRRKARQ